jgi:short-subunit dehydrogenase
MIALENSVVAITGAGRGIGREAARLFVQGGARVCLGDLDGDAAADAAAAIGTGAHPFQVDVRSEDSVKEFVISIEDTIGPVDVLVNNAGVMPAGGFLDEDPETTRTVIAVNLVGPINAMRAVLPGMVERGRGHVVNVASMLGRTELPGLASYVASKHALVGLTAAVRAELRGTEVTFTTVLPGVVNTELSAGIALPRALGRFARVEPEDVARAIVDSCHRDDREVAVPRWLALYPALRPFIPSAVESFVRRLIGDDRALNAVDAEQRAAYAERIARQVRD